MHIKSKSKTNNLFFKHLKLFKLFFSEITLISLIKNNEEYSGMLFGIWNHRVILSHSM